MNFKYLFHVSTDIFTEYLPFYNVASIWQDAKYSPYLQGVLRGSFGKDFTAETVLQLYLRGGKLGAPGRGTACEAFTWLVQKHTEA